VINGDGHDLTSVEHLQPASLELVQATIIKNHQKHVPEAQISHQTDIPLEDKPANSFSSHALTLT